MALNRYNITDAIQGKSHNECNGQTNPSYRQKMQKKLQENILISDSNMNVPCSWYCVKHWCCLVFCRHIVGLMTLALDSMIEPSQSHAYPEASTILRSIVYSSSNLQGWMIGSGLQVHITCFFGMACAGVVDWTSLTVHSVSTKACESHPSILSDHPNNLALVGLLPLLQYECLFTFAYFFNFDIV